MERIELLSIVGAIIAPFDRAYDENEVIKEAADLVTAAIRFAAHWFSVTMR